MMAVIYIVREDLSISKCWLRHCTSIIIINKHSTNVRVSLRVSSDHSLNPDSV